MAKVAPIDYRWRSGLALLNDRCWLPTLFGAVLRPARGPRPFPAPGKPHLRDRPTRIPVETDSAPARRAALLRLYGPRYPRCDLPDTALSQTGSLADSLAPLHKRVRAGFAKSSTGSTLAGKATSGAGTQENKGILVGQVRLTRKEPTGDREDGVPGNTTDIEKRLWDAADALRKSLRQRSP